MFKRLLVAFLDTIFPPACAACGNLNDQPVCPACREKLHLITGPVCEFCGKPTALPVARCRECSGKRLSFDFARSSLVYDGIGKELVHAYKFNNDRRLADFFASLMAEKLAGRRADLITWVPIHSRKRAGRGFDQSQLLAGKLSLILNVPAAALLTKSRHTEDQSGLDMGNRKKNVRDAFRVNDVEFKRKSILLIDDVYTTGSTLNECAKMIKRAGASRVEALTAARAVL